MTLRPATTTTTAATLLFLVASLLPAVLCFPAEDNSVEKTPLRDEFCRFKYCAVMSASSQDQCCSAYNQCCAYVELRMNPGPFAFHEPGEVVMTPPPPPTTTYKPSDIYVGPPRSMRLREEAKPPSMSLTRHHHHNRHHLTTTPEPIAAIHLLRGGKDLLKTSYNDQLVKDHERLCVHSYCSLLTPSQHKLCCNIYDECCAYSNYHIFTNPFHLENGRRRR